MIANRWHARQPSKCLHGQPPTTPPTSATANPSFQSDGSIPRTHPFRPTSKAPCNHSLWVIGTALARSSSPASSPFFLFSFLIPHDESTHIAGRLKFKCSLIKGHNSLAYMEMRLIVAKLLWNFDIRTIDNAALWNPEGDYRYCQAFTS